MDAFGYGLMLGIGDNIEQAIRETGRSNNQQAKQVKYDWQAPEFQNGLEAILVSFYSRHPELSRVNKDFATRYPDKKNAILTLNKLSESNAISPSDFLVLYKEIYDF